MAYLDRAAHDREIFEKEAYDSLRRLLLAKDENQKLNEHYAAIFHLQRMENKLSEQEKQLDEYRAFFSKMAQFIPKQSSIHDVIG